MSSGPVRLVLASSKGKKVPTNAEIKAAAAKAPKKK